MQDMEMSVAEAGGTSREGSIAPPPAGFPMKKKKGLKLKQLMHKGKGNKKKNNSPKASAVEASPLDSMME
ncbi:hypothetical protein CDL15_Pgr021917 [Punica granatum]|nr:hypothetical protein CDL15_Pgr021917 [Punica granatum]